ncbi:sugar phosphate nucleotidyltransferase [Paludicola sp. MB14-C6]|uniref:nucleotidyltransferase family protein n=1 Tax=Paludihabitans sp. MB14-C6 TaxID=3070656 RepID=UPI0027DDF7FD|nr:sugar phosphate nucleotidyltransferase [Paludicola sp. MB14-C6]WMJ23920.1 sugar phosphate nucleotidyltransferase [Paludicola sp. MB14-C6]
MKMTLVILAAGMGNRYGGLKQIDPVGKNGEFIIDYSIYDAIQAGFNKIVFIIKEENLEVFQQTIGNRISNKIQVEYAFQRMDDIPEGVIIPKDRVKPLGTAQALLSCEGLVKENFAVINADDFYGRESYQLVADFLKKLSKKTDKLQFCMIGYILKNTLTDHGHVARGICETDKDGFLSHIVERTRIEKKDGKVAFFEEETGYEFVDENSTVSMNFWGFTPEIFSEIRKEMKGFFEANKANLKTVEYLLPSEMQNLIGNGVCDVKVIPTHGQWFGVTYANDKPKVVEYIQKLTADHVYPEKL